MTMRSFRFIYCLLAVGLFAVPSESRAQAQTENQSVQALQQEIDQLKNDLDALKQQYGNRLASLEAKMSALQGRQVGLQSLVLTSLTTPAAEAPLVRPPVQAPSGAEGTAIQAPSQGVSGSSVGNAKVFNP